MTLLMFSISKRMAYAFYLSNHLVASINNGLQSLYIWHAAFSP